MNAIANNIKNLQSVQPQSEPATSVPLDEFTMQQTIKLETQKYIAKNIELNLFFDVVPERDYAAEYLIIFQQILDSDTKTIEEKETLWNQLYSINQESISSLVIEKTLEDELVNYEQELYSKYLEETSINYVGTNPVALVYIDYLQQKTVLIINPELPDGDNFNLSKVGIAQNSILEKGSDKLKIIFEVPNPVTCTSKTSECNPLMSGIQLGRVVNHDMVEPIELDIASNIDRMTYVLQLEPL